MSNRIKQTFEAYAEITGNGVRENPFSADYKPEDPHELMRKEYYALSAYIIDWSFAEVEKWREQNPGQIVINQNHISEEWTAEDYAGFSYAHLHYAKIPENKILEQESGIMLFPPYKTAEIKLGAAVSVTTSYLTHVLFDRLKHGANVPEQKKKIWQRWEVVLKERRIQQPHSVHGRRKQVDWGFMHGWGSIRAITRQVLDAFYSAYGHLPQQHEFPKVKNDIKNYLINLSLLTTPLEIYFDKLSDSYEKNHMPFFQYNLDADSAELEMLAPPVSELTREAIYAVINSTTGKTGIDKVFADQRIGCPATLHRPQEHNPSVISRTVDFYLDIYQQLLQHPQATEWYEQELVQRAEELASFL